MSSFELRTSGGIFMWDVHFCSSLGFRAHKSEASNSARRRRIVDGSFPAYLAPFRLPFPHSFITLGDLFAGCFFDPLNPSVEGALMERFAIGRILKALLVYKYPDKGLFQLFHAYKYSLSFHKNIFPYFK